MADMHYADGLYTQGIKVALSSRLYIFKKIERKKIKVPFFFL